MGLPSLRAIAALILDREFRRLNKPSGSADARRYADDLRQRADAIERTGLVDPEGLRDIADFIERL